MRGVPQWVINTSVWCNDRTGGPPGYSLCARAWEARLQGRAMWANILDTLLFWDEQHCRKAWLTRTR